MDLIITTPHQAFWGARELRCAIGRGGLISADAKKEGDGATPIGRWVLREVFYRADRLSVPETILPVHVLQKDDGWCENPEDPHYNRFIKNSAGSAVDRFWREDHLYDIIVTLGYNDDPVVVGKGSAIFLHLGTADHGPSAGCVRLAREDLLMVLREASAGSAVVVRGRA